MKLHLRKCLVKCWQHLRQGKAAPERRHAHIQYTAVCTQDIGHLRIKLPFLAEQALGMKIVPLSSVGQFQPTATPPEQGQPQFFFQLLQIFGKGRLADIELPCRMGQIAAFCNGRKIFQFLQVHFRFPTFFQDSFIVPRPMHAGYCKNKKNEFSEL